MIPEPKNHYYMRVITFQCKVDEWHRVGYVLIETLNDVQTDLEKKLLLQAHLSWVKYLVLWTHFGTGLNHGSGNAILIKANVFRLLYTTLLL